jgi:hypothetical protein
MMPQVYRVKSGTYNLKIRTRNEWVELNRVKIEEDLKTFIGINLGLKEASKQMTVTPVDSVPFVLAERQKFENHYLLFRNVAGHNMYLTQDSLVVNLSGNKRPFNYTDRDEGGGYLKIGPFKKGEIKVVNLSTDSIYSFYFEPGYLYESVMDTIKIIKPNLIPDVYQNDRYQYANVHTNFDALPFSIPKLRKKKEKEAIEKVIKEVTEKEIDINNPIRNKLLRTIPPSLYPPNYPAYVSVKNNTGKSIKWIVLRNKENKKSGVWINSWPQSYPFAQGEYKVTAVYSDSTYAQQLLCIQDSGANHIVLHPHRIKSYNKGLIDSLKEDIIELNRAPLIDFRYAPKTVSHYTVSYVNNKNSNLRLSGYFLNARKDPMYSVVLFFEKKGKFIEGAVTNQDGYFEINDIDPGVYTLKVRINRFKEWIIQAVVIEKNKETRLLVIEELSIENLQEIQEIELVDEYYIEPSRTNSVKSSEQITNLPIRSTNSIAAMTPGVQIGYDGELRFRGARSSNSAVFIDGVKVRGDAALPRESIALEEVQISGMPAQYGYIAGSEVKLKDVSAFQAGEVSDKYVNYITEENSAPKLLDLKIEGTTNRIRKEFRDYGYWVPNLITDKSGQVQFSVTLPD